MNLLVLDEITFRDAGRGILQASLRCSADTESHGKERIEISVCISGGDETSLACLRRAALERSREIIDELLR